MLEKLSSETVKHRMLESQLEDCELRATLSGTFRLRRRHYFNQTKLNEIELSIFPANNAKADETNLNALSIFP